MSYIDLINNLAILLVLTIPYQYILRKWQRNSLNARIATGFLFAALTVIGMKVSVPFAPGIIFDARSVFISVGSLFGGPIVMAIVSSVSIFYRIWLGGPGVPMGISVIVSSAALGGLFYFLRTRGYQTTRPLMLLILGIFVHLVMVSFIPLMLPTPYSDQVFAQVASHILIIFPLGTLILGTVLADIESRVESEDLLRQSEEKIKEREQHYRAITEDSPSLICRYKTNGEILYANPAYCDYFGKTQQELIGKTFFSLIPEKDHENSHKIIASLSLEKPTFVHEYREVKASGDIRWQRWVDRAVFDDHNQIIAYQAVGEDITLQKQQEETLQQTLDQLQLAVDTAKLGIWYLDLKTNHLEWNDQQLNIYGITRETFESDLDGWRSQVHPDDQAYTDQQFQQIFEGHSVYDVEFRIRRPDGEIRYLQASGSPIYSPDQDLIGLVGINIDITHIKKNEETLQTRESYLQAIFENSLNGIIVADDKGNYKSVNQAAANMLGYSVETLTNMNVSQIQTVQSLNVANQYEEYLTKEKEVGQFEVVHTNGEKRTLLYHAIRINTDFNLSILSDITEQKRLEQEERKINNLESLGLLAGGIAHDFNNVLTGITGNLSLLDMLLTQGSEAHNIVQETKEAALRTRGLTQQLMTFAKGGAPIRETTSIQELIQKVTQQSLRGSNTQPVYKIASDLYNVHADLGQISQVIQNLVINADQAMPNGGALTVMAENVSITKEDGLPLDTGEYVQVSITDQGMGIQQNQIHQIFDPYFSTKETGHGLGLSICHSIITRHNGYITAKSDPPIGSTFTFYLPASFTTTPTGATEKTLSHQGTGRILLMDDEEIIHKTIVRALSHLGYDVESVYNGQDALQAYQSAQQQNTPFDLVIMDLTIPGNMGGKETVSKLRDIAPNARVIVASGYSNDPILTNPQAHGFDGALHKPIDLDEMSHVIKQVLA